MIFTYMRFNGLVPLLLPIVCTGIAVYEGQYTGGVTGLFAGVLCDISFNQPVGVFTVLLTLTGLLIGTLADTIIMRSFVTYYLACFAVLALSAFVQMFPLLFLASIPPQLLAATALQQTIYSLVFAFPIWFFVRALGKRAERVSPSGRPL
jgi:rod shape-determining protein MreD